MSSVECLRELINERLTAAAEEIFTVCQKTLVEYQKEIDHQRRLLDIVLKPELKLHRTDVPRQHVCKEEEVLTDQKLCNQERNSSLDQDDPEPPQIKEEQEELCMSLEGEQLVLKQETETFMLTPTYEESDNSEDQTLDLSPDETQNAAERQHFVIVSVKGSVEPEPNRYEQLLYHNSHVAQSQDHNGGKHGGSGSTGNAETNPKKRCHESHSDNVCNPTMSMIQLNTHTGKMVSKCDTCGKAFKYISVLNQHQKVHTGEKPYQCSTCEEGFSLVSNLKDHLRVHTGEKPYKCNTCEKGFSQLRTLNVHMRVHTGEKRYPCSICEKRFSLQSTLIKHMRVHTGEKPYICNTCEKRFSQLHTLKDHMTVHTGEKPYTCQTCEKRFSQLSNLKKHMRIHTGEKPYNCKTCARAFRHGYQLKDHMRTHTVGKDSV